jgi:thioredoxin-dependent peroxiredoxin
MLLFNNIWLILFISWGLPLTFYRSKFRKIVYQTDSWTINIKPYFWKELKALFGNLFPDNMSYLKFRNFYRFYLIIYLLVFASYLTFSKTNNMNEIKIESTISD